MVIQFLRENKAVSFVLAVIRVYLGYTWLHMVNGWNR